MIFNIICASHDDNILNKNLAASLFFKRSVNNSNVNVNSLILRGYKNIAKAYNKANEIMYEDEHNLFIHHDVFLPDSFESDLIKAITEINSIDDNWGVVGVAGATIENGNRKFYGHIKDRGREWTHGELPHEVQTLDELLLITKGDFVFDEQFDLHFYGADICMQAIKQGRKNYAIDAYVHHNSTLPIGYRSKSFKECEIKFKDKWKDWLPIVTTCTIIQ